MEEKMLKKIVLLGMAMVFLLSSCALPGGSSAKSEEPTQVPAKEEVQVEKPAKAPTAEEAPPEEVAPEEVAPKEEAPAEQAPEPTVEEDAASGVDFRDEFDLPNDNFTEDFILTTQAGNRDLMITEPSSVQDGILDFKIRDAETYIYKFVNGSMAEDVAIEAKWISKGQSLNGIALICRAAEDNSSWYEARISAQGNWQIMQYDKSIRDANEFKNPYKELKKGVSKKGLIKPARDNITKFTCQGTTLTFELNGTELGHTDNGAIKGGGLVGLGVMSSTFLPAQIDFDYFSTTAP